MKSNRNRIVLFLLWGAYVTSATATAQAADDGATLQQLLNRFNRSQHHSLHFTQYDQTLEAQRPSPTDQEAAARQGALFLSLPHHFRFEYFPPQPYLIIGSKNILYLHDPILNQLVIQPMDTSMHGPATILLRKTTVARLHKIFSSITLVSADSTTRIFRLTPSDSDAQYKTLELTMHKNGTPKKIKWQDVFGADHHIVFTQKAANTPPSRPSFCSPAIRRHGSN